MDQLIQRLQNILIDIVTDIVSFVPGLLAALIILALTQ